MSYTTDMWHKYLSQVLEMYRDGYMVHEIANRLESNEELVNAVIQKYAKEAV